MNTTILVDASITKIKLKTMIQFNKKFILIFTLTRNNTVSNTKKFAMGIT